MRAEVAARPDEIRQAVALSRTSPEAMQQKSLWARLQSFWLGGGVVVGAAAAVLFVVTRAPDLAPAAPTAAKSEVAPTATSPEPPPPPAPETAKLKRDEAPHAGAVEGDGLLQDALGAPQSQKGGGANELRAGLDRKSVDESEKKAEAKEQPPAEAPKDLQLKSDPKPVAKPDADAYDDGDARLDYGNAALNSADSAGAGPGAARGQLPTTATTTPMPPPMPTTPPATAPPSPSKKPMPSPSPMPSADAPSSTSVGSGGYTSAEENVRRFEALSKAKKTAQIERERAAEPKAANGKAALTPTEAKEEIERSKRIDGASMMLTTAERELAAGHPQQALDLAVSAESSGGGALGLVPASLQARAFVALKRNADAARVGSRLLQGDAGDPSLVSGMIAAADAALAVGDRRLATRLLERAVMPANKDAALRASAQKKLQALRAAETRYEDSAAETAPAKASASAPSSTDQR